MIPSYFTSNKHKLIIYQLFVRLFGNQKAIVKAYGTLEDNGCGKFNDITDTALQELSSMGISHVWLTGILEHSTVTDYSAYGIKCDSPYLVKGRAGSPYAIRDYYDVDPDLAVDVNNRMQEFNALVKRIHSNHLKVIIDFVPNHVARSYHSDVKPDGVNDLGEDDMASHFFDVNNNFLYLQNSHFSIPGDYVPLNGEEGIGNRNDYFESPARVTGNDIYSASPSANDWFETVKLNFGVDPNPPHHCYFDPIPDTWQKLLDILLYWSAKGVDGFRCDMAEMVPAEFWEWVIPCVKTHFPKVFFIAEIYKPELYERYLETGCFDYLYDKVRLYDTLVGIIKGHTNADELTNCARSVERHPERMLFFLENHDEERIASFRFAGDPNKAIPGMVAGTALSCGPVMIYNGQECGEKGDEIVGFVGCRGRTSIFDYTSMPEHLKWMNKGRFDGANLSTETKKLRDFYVKLFNVINKSEAISSGKFYDLQYVNRHHLSEGFNEKYIYAYLRYTENERVLVICNFNSREEFNVHVKIPMDALELMGIKSFASYIFYDLLNEEKIGEGLCEEFTNLKERKNGLQIIMKCNGARVIRF